MSLSYSSLEASPPPLLLLAEYPRVQTGGVAGDVYSYVLVKRLQLIGYSANVRTNFLLLQKQSCPNTLQICVCGEGVVWNVGVVWVVWVCVILSVQDTLKAPIMDSNKSP